MRGLEKKCTRWRRQTDTHTHGHGDSMTNLSQWGRVGEKAMDAYKTYQEISLCYSDCFDNIIVVFLEGEGVENKLCFWFIMKKDT